MGIPNVKLGKFKVVITGLLMTPGVTADFTTYGESHFFGLPCPSANSLDPMDHFCTFDVSKIIPKNMQ